MKHEAQEKKEKEGEENIGSSHHSAGVLVLGQSHTGRLVCFTVHQDFLPGPLWMLRGTLWRTTERTALSQSFQDLWVLLLKEIFAVQVLKGYDFHAVFLLCCCRISEWMFLNVFNNIVLCNLVHASKESLGHDIQVSITKKVLMFQGTYRSQ